MTVGFKGLRPISHLQFSRAILSRECATKSRDKVASISVQHSVNRVAQNRAELYSEIELRATVQNSRNTLCHTFSFVATKLREKIVGVTSV